MTKSPESVADFTRNQHGKPLQQVAAELGVHTNQLRMWRIQRFRGEFIQQLHQARRPGSADRDDRISRHRLSSDTGNRASGDMRN
jgi:transposase-like protein